MIDVITTKFFPPCFKMAASFETLQHILHDWAKDKYKKKSIVEVLNRYEKPSLAGRIKVPLTPNFFISRQKSPFCSDRIGEKIIVVRFFLDFSSIFPRFSVNF